MTNPSSGEMDPMADPNLDAAGGYWQGGYSPQSQAHWAETFGSLLLSKSYVQAVHWADASDAEIHQFPNCGLIDASGSPKPVLDILRTLREKHLL